MLEPGEVFEHMHQGDSTTMLIEGAVDIVIGDVRSPLVVGEPVRLDSGTHHWLINVGAQIAMLKCVHGTDAPPGS
jgi:mannose-6-phosphate isomerase-like protein (cupin superfamily)